MPVFSKIASFSQFRGLLKSQAVANVAKTGKSVHSSCTPVKASENSIESAAANALQIFFLRWLNNILHS